MANFPVTIDNDGTLLFAKNYVRSPLSGSMTDTQTTIPVTDGTQFPTPYGFVAKPGTASAAAVAGSNLGVGTYKYQVTYVTLRDGANFETDGGTEFSVVTTGGNQSVSLTSIPVSGSSFTVKRKIYRTAVGGATGTEKLVTTINDNTGTTYTDTTADGSLGASVTTTNTTGATYFAAIDAITSATREICGYAGVEGNVLTWATRGQRGTTAFAHSSGVLVEQNIIDAFHEFHKASIIALQTKIGVDASAVTTTMDYKLSSVGAGEKAVSLTGSQTLTNKTLTSPVLNTPTITSPSIVTDITFTSAATKFIAGATSVSFRNAANTFDNLLIADAGAITIRNDFTISAGNIVMGAAVSRLVSGGTSFAIRNNGNSADNLLSTDAGAITIRNDFTMSAGKIVMSAAASQLVPGATSFAVRNNGNSADNLLISDAGFVTVRAGMAITTGHLNFNGSASQRIIASTTDFAITNSAATFNNIHITDAGVITMRNSLTGVTTLTATGLADLRGGVTNGAASGNVNVTTNGTGQFQYNGIEVTTIDSLRRYAVIGW